MTGKNHRPATSVMRLAVLCFALVLAAAPAWPLDEPPLVGASIRVEAPDFQRFQGDLEGKVDTRLAELCNDWFGFLRWRSVSDTSLPPPEMVLIARVVAKDTGGLSPTIVLKYSGRIRQQQRELPAPERILYESWDDQPTQNEPKFRQRIIDVLSLQFANEDFRRLLHEAFVQEISLTREVRVSNADQRILLPLSWEALRASRESELEVRFSAERPDDNQLREGVIAMNPEVRFLGDPWPGSVQCVVNLFSFAPLVQSGWHDQVTVVLQPPRLKELKGVYMKRYQRAATVDARGGTVLDP